jgi:hypothetical protein
MKALIIGGAGVLVIGLVLIILAGPGYLIVGLGCVMLAIGAIGKSPTKRP